jgi:hypothetical protein
MEKLTRRAPFLFADKVRGILVITSRKPVCESPTGRDVDN